MQGWHLPSRSPQLDCLSNGSNGFGGARPSTWQASSRFTSLLSPPSSSMAVKHGPYLLTEKEKDPGFGNKVNEETSPQLLLSFVGQPEHLLATVKRRKLAWFAATASPKSSFRAPGRMGDAVVGSENVG